MGELCKVPPNPLKLLKSLRDLGQMFVICSAKILCTLKNKSGDLGFSILNLRFIVNTTRFRGTRPQF